MLLRSVVPSEGTPAGPNAPKRAMNYQACPMCGSEGIEYEFVVDRVAFARCRECGLLFSNPSGVAAPQSVPVSAPPEVLAFAARVLGRTPATVLQFTGDASGLAPDARFDCIVADGLIDRAADPLGQCRLLREHLTPDGVLVVTVPSIASAEARAQRERWWNFRSKANWYFSPDTLQLGLTRAGFGGFVTLVNASDCAPQPSAALRRYFASNLALFARPAAPAERRVLSIIVPVYNEAATVAQLLDLVLAKTIPDVAFEVVIVESNSTDGSREIVSKYTADPRVKLVLEERPRGKGHAVRTGLEHATGEVVLFQDADLEYDVDDYDQLVEPLFALRKNFVLGSRHGATGDGWKIRRFAENRLVSTAMNMAHLALLTIFNRLYDQKLFDPFTMYKVFRRDCIAGLRFECDRFDFDYEINIKLIRKGYQPTELLVNYRSRSFGEGKKVAFISDPPTWIRAMLRHRDSPLYRF